jgi:mannose-6-phosphate isomerase-like protein (cupin superfamily)
MHSHNCDEHVTVLDGEAEVLVEGEVTRLDRYDSTYVQLPVPHLPADDQMGSSRTDAG